jgi:DNA-binding NarL/FixJ family response regulator
MMNRKGSFFQGTTGNKEALIIPDQSSARPEHQRFAASKMRGITPERKRDAIEPHRNVPENDESKNNLIVNLTKTELKILSKIGEGFASDEIARTLDLAVGTVRNYVSSIMHKIGLRNRPEMARYAFSSGLVRLNPSCYIQERRNI